MKDIDEIRRVNLHALETAAGGTSAISKLVGMSDSQFANLRDGAKDSRTGKPRGMRKETAWRFEDAFDKPRGWLDQDHSGDDINRLPCPPWLSDEEFAQASDRRRVLAHDFHEMVKAGEIPASTAQSLWRLSKTA